MLKKTGVFTLGTCVLMAAIGCSQDQPAPVRGDVDMGRALARQAGCGSCHHIPGIDSADGKVGPPLDKLARRAYLAGVLPNNFNNLVLWIREPQQVAPGSAMPNVGLSQQEAEDVAAYLYTLD